MTQPVNPAASDPNATPEGGELSEYEIETDDGNTYTAQLTKAEAEARGLTGGGTEKPASGADRAHKTTDASKAATDPANKRKTPPSNK